MLGEDIIDKFWYKYIIPPIFNFGLDISVLLIGFGIIFYGFGYRKLLKWGLIFYFLVVIILGGVI
jgi:hypothetical protein